MIANNQPWKAIVNTNNFAKDGAKESQLTVVKKGTAQRTNAYQPVMKVVTKRYSFDDNGGGYLGL